MSDPREPHAYESSEELDALWDTDLTDEQLAWSPAGGTDLWEQALPWKCERWPKALDGHPVDVIALTNGAGPDWDWRALAYWIRALGPAWRVHLRHGGRIDLIAPAAPPTETHTDPT
ncbi:hypothetical protein [Nocardioides sambongensis]|uniref:hypothetical protein n=1 Tax=Nocardioides sambongensis TaxID=2589074 RepID=UPI001127646F|nr:hypothetical protein [Nocardioides sambongensis]